MADLYYFDSRPKLRPVPIQSVRGNSRASERSCHWLRKQFSSQRHEWIVRFVRENRQMANRNLYREDVLQMLFADLTLKGNICLLEMTIGPSNDRASPGTSLQRNGAARARRESSRSTNKWSFDPCPTGMGVAGVDVVVVSIGELLISELNGAPLAPRRGADDQPDCVFFSDRARSTGRQYRCSQCGVGLPYSQEL